MSGAPVIFDFDGVIVESELAGNLHLADLLTDLGRPTSLADAVREFTGLSGTNFFRALEAWLGGPVPEAFHTRRGEEDRRIMREGVEPVAGALEFVADLPPGRPVAIVSSSDMRWLDAHLGHHRIKSRFEPHIYSGKTHVEHSKPAPDIYLYAAEQLAADPGSCFVIEDSPVGVTAAAKAGMQVCGLLAAGHVLDGHGDRLREAGARWLAKDYEQVAAHLAAFDAEERA
ncbi:hypothetical protein B5C34_04245 [Pacificimonas flava]|uniref:Haloacid dehalogenase n=2 Tax=Pacificimonas TaxID=1960290 RepID=A0A219B4N3_9SPHN|nr:MULTISPECIES: HAD family phosphatase [Pacificimonas]MBZ6377570.1 HAD family phosphatase [Pacificimonas aurantium]OWV32738.1 hypothetical protein B5C34_04245 [Pacificimonas flava]